MYYYKNLIKIYDTNSSELITFEADYGSYVYFSIQE